MTAAGTEALAFPSQARRRISSVQAAFHGGRVRAGDDCGDAGEDAEFEDVSGEDAELVELLAAVELSLSGLLPDSTLLGVPMMSFGSRTGRVRAHCDGVLPAGLLAAELLPDVEVLSPELGELLIFSRWCDELCAKGESHGLGKDVCLRKFVTCLAGG